MSSLFDYKLMLIAAIECSVMGAFSDGYEARGEGTRNRADAEKRCEKLKKNVSNWLTAVREEERENARRLKQMERGSKR